MSFNCEYPPDCFATCGEPGTQLRGFGKRCGTPITFPVRSSAPAAQSLSHQPALPGDGRMCGRQGQMASRVHAIGMDQGRRKRSDMPTSPPIACSTPGCGGRRRNGVCDRGCGYGKRKTAAQGGWQSSPLYRTYRWQQRRERQLQDEPLCRHCMEEGMVTPATVADHIVPWRSEEEFWWNELQSLCASHHGAKSANERGAAK